MGNINDSIFDNTETENLSDLQLFDEENHPPQTTVPMKPNCFNLTSSKFEHLKFRNGRRKHENATLSKMKIHKL
jgi:hypothetical protein